MDYVIYWGTYDMGDNTLVALLQAQKPTVAQELTKRWKEAIPVYGPIPTDQLQQRMEATVHAVIDRLRRHAPQHFARYLEDLVFATLI